MYNLKDIERAFEEYRGSNLLFFHLEGCKTTDVTVNILFIPIVILGVSKILNTEVQIPVQNTPLKINEIVALYYQEYLKTEDYPA